MVSMAFPVRGADRLPEPPLSPGAGDDTEEQCFSTPPLEVQPDELTVDEQNALAIGLINGLTALEEGKSPPRSHKRLSSKVIPPPLQLSSQHHQGQLVPDSVRSHYTNAQDDTHDTTTTNKTHATPYDSNGSNDNQDDLHVNNDPPSDPRISSDSQPSTEPRVSEDSNTTSSTATSSPPTGVLSPPYWQTLTRARATSHASQASISTLTKPPRIRLEDNTSPSPAGVRSPLWARVVRIPGHAVVAGTIRGVGDYVVWMCHVDTLDGGTIVLRKRYSEFEGLREELRVTFPNAALNLPALPPKSVLYKFRTAFLEKRRVGLEYFLNCILLNPEFASSAILKGFVFC